MIFNAFFAAGFIFGGFDFFSGRFGIPRGFFDALFGFIGRFALLSFFMAFSIRALAGILSGCVGGD